MRAQRGVVTFVTPSPPSPQSPEPRQTEGNCVSERKHSNRVSEDILPGSPKARLCSTRSLGFEDPLLLGRGAGMGLLNRPVAGDKWHLRHFVTVTVLCLPMREP